MRFLQIVKKQSSRLKWLCIEVAHLCCDLSDALPEMRCLCFVNTVPKVSIFVGLAARTWQLAQWGTLTRGTPRVTTYATIGSFVLK